MPKITALIDALGAILVPSLIFATASVTFVVAFLWWRKRREDPEYAPAWTIAYVYGAGAVLLAGMFFEYLLGKAAPARGRHSSRAVLNMESGK